MEQNTTKKFQNSSRRTLQKGDICLVKLPTKKTPYVPGSKIRPALILDITNTKQGTVLHFLWSRTFKESREIVDCLTPNHMVIDRAVTLKSMGADNPVLIDMRDTIPVPLQTPFFPDPEKPRVIGQVPKGLLLKIEELHNAYMQSKPYRPTGIIRKPF